jgi:hypothetical protein
MPRSADQRRSRNKGRLPRPCEMGQTSTGRRSPTARPPTPAGIYTYIYLWYICGRDRSCYFCSRCRYETISNLGVVWVRLTIADRGERNEVAGHGGVDRERRHRPVAGGQRAAAAVVFVRDVGGSSATLFALPVCGGPPAHVQSSSRDHARPLHARIQTYYRKAGVFTTPSARDGAGDQGSNQTGVPGEGGNGTRTAAPPMIRRLGREMTWVAAVWKYTV